MLRIHMSGSVAAAKSYYTSGLGQDDYYAGQELPGLWFGEAAERLGLSGEVGKEDFHALCDNIRPDTGEKLNPRSNKDRRVGYDCVFSAPKSVSILQGVLGDERITEAFQAAVRRTMTQIEKDAHVRVRKNGAVDDRQTGNLVWGEFTHFTSRPVDEVSAPDPNLHVHAYVFNTSYDEVEGRFKAGEFFHIKRDAPYFEAMFHNRLAEELQAIGYEIENKPFSFEIAGVGEENVKRFSRRTAEIEKLAEELGIAGNDRAKDGLGATTRKNKSANLTQAEIEREWLGRLDRSAFGVPVSNHRTTAADAADYAISRNFERRSVVAFRRLVGDALQFSVGSCTVEEIEAEFENREDLIVTDEGVTTWEILEEEKEILAGLQYTRGSQAPFLPGYESSSRDEDQKAAIEALANSTDMIFVIEGRAGTGKTTMMREAVAMMGKPVFTFAPTSEAAHKVLEQEGFENSNTVQQLLVNAELQSEMQDGVIWVDEAGLLSVAEVNQLMKIAHANNARLVFSGDTHQHHSVNRGDGLRLIAQSGLVEVKETRHVYRQKDEKYRNAVEAISKGKVGDAFWMLDQMGAVIEPTDTESRCEAIAEAYAEDPETLVISPTHAEAEITTNKIREKLKQMGVLSGEREAVTHINRNLTEAERRESLCLNKGDIVKFHQNARDGFRKGEVFRIEHIGIDGRVWLDDGDRLRQLDPAGAKHYQIYRESPLPIAIGDKIRLTQNLNPDGKRLFNGSIHTVTGFEGNKPVIGDGTVIPDGSFAYGYVSTSHSSQGKTTDKVIISQSSLSAAASSLEQFYVSISRGRTDIKIYTDSKEDLLSNVQSSAERKLAIELELGEFHKKKRRRRMRDDEEPERWTPSETHHEDQPGRSR